MSTPLWNRTRAIVMLVTVALSAVSCAGDASTTTTSEPTASTSVPTTTAPTTSTSTTAAPTSTTTPPTTTTTSSATTTEATTSTTTVAPSTTTTLPGEPIDIGPRAGDVLIVAGVRYDDVLNVREIPGLGGTIIDTLDPLATGITALGNSRLLPASLWYEIDTGSAIGWSSSRFLYHQGFTDDLTAAVVADLGEIPTGSTVDEVAAVVAMTRASEEPMSDITIASAATTSGDLREIIVDVIGLGDDALGGERLHVFVEPLDGGGFSLDTVERTLLCLRGATEDGLCV